MTRIERHVGSDREVLAYLKTRFSIYHQSNIFFRDIQFGIQTYLRERGVKAGYGPCEKVAREFVERMVRQSIFVPIDRQSWVLYFPDYKTPQTKAPAPAKPAPKPPAAAVPVAPLQ